MKQKRYYQKNNIPPEAEIIFAIIMAIVIIYIFAIQPAINYIKEHKTQFIIIGIILFILFII